MKDKLKNKVSDEAVERLLPEHLSYLFEDKPLLWNESEEEYDALTGAIFAELDPQGVIETLLAKDIVDYIWEDQAHAVPPGGRLPRGAPRGGRGTDGR